MAVIYFKANACDSFVVLQKKCSGLERKKKFGEKDAQSVVDIDFCL